MKKLRKYDMKNIKEKIIDNKLVIIILAIIIIIKNKKDTDLSIK